MKGLHCKLWEFFYFLMYPDAREWPVHRTGVELWSCYYHLTHNRNLTSIFTHGIQSWTNAHAQGLTKKDISDNEVQKWRKRVEPIYKRAIHDYVPLYINPRNPMLYRRKSDQCKLVILRVSKDIAKKQHVYTDGNAASKITKFAKNRNELDMSDAVLRARWWNEVPDGKRKRCAELLVYPEVEPCFITEVICNNRSLAHAVNRISPVPVKVDLEMFF